MGGACSTHGEMTITEKNLIGKPENRRFCRRRCRINEFSTRFEGSARLGASLSKDGSRTGFRNVVFQENLDYGQSNKKWDYVSD